MNRNILFGAPLAVFALAIVALVALLPAPQTVLWALVYGITSGDESDEAGQMAQFVREHFRFPKGSMQAPDQWLAFGVPGSRGLLEAHQQLWVFYIIDSGDQDRLVALVSGYLKAHPHHATDICFFESENWTTWFNPANGARGGNRGPEKLLRRVVLR